jgi:hypothetical protein
MMELQDMIAARDELRAQAREIRTGSADLSLFALAEAQQKHRRLMQRIAQMNDAIRNH